MTKTKTKAITLACEISYQPTGAVECWQVTGDSLEGAGIPDGSFVLIDMGITSPNRGDISKCIISEKSPEPLLKKIIAPYGPESAIVATVYANIPEIKNPWIQVKSAQGAAFACVDCDGRLIREILVNTPPVDPYEKICPKFIGDINTAEGWNGIGAWHAARRAWYEANKDNEAVIKYEAALRKFRAAQQSEPGALS